MTRSRDTSEAFPPPFRWSLPDRFRIKPSGIGYEIEIGYDQNSALSTRMFAFTQRGAERKARRYIERERRRLVSPEAPWTITTAADDR